MRELGAGYGQLNDTQYWNESHANCDDNDIECWFNVLDFNGDGLPDIINPKHLGEEATIGAYYKWRYLMNDPEAASGRFTEQSIPTTHLMVDWNHQVHIADLDGDGAHDLLELSLIHI